MITAIFILGVLHCAGLVVLANAIWDAPAGYQDSDGYHWVESGCFKG